jgi:Family of unknown function (DUF6644)
MNLLNILPTSFFRWWENMPVGHYIRETTWVFAIVETVHIMALAVLLGTRVVVDLRLMGLGMKKQSTAELSEILDPWFWISLVTMIVTGVCLFASEAVRLSHSGPFAFKMIFLLLAITVQLTIHRKAIANGVEGTPLEKGVACLSLLSWFAIALAGRAIPFL